LDVIYEWDPKKADENLKRHKVSFDEATSVFTDPFALTFDDPDHSLEERRYATIGYFEQTANRVSRTRRPGRRSRADHQRSAGDNSRSP
jgi:uncharacterized protein